MEEPSPSSPSPSAPAPIVPTPYRDGKALADIIPPDTRRQKTIALVVASMIAGVCLWQLGGWGLEMLANREPIATPTPSPGYIAGRIRPSILHGPGGDMPMPPSTRTVLHVWLQGCADCMPAFDAMRDLEQAGGLGVRVPIINIAYGEADTTWAHRYGVDHNLVFDPGGANVVKPLGIGTFTTLVVDRDGAIIHRDRPDRAGYRDRVRAAVGSANLDPDPSNDPTDPLPPTPPQDPTAGGLDASAVQRVVAAHRTQIKRVCWDRMRGDQASANLTVSLEIDADGHVTKATGTGDNPLITKCIQEQTKTWLFPASGSGGGGGGGVSVHIPFKFVRE